MKKEDTKKKPDLGEEATVKDEPAQTKGKYADVLGRNSQLIRTFSEEVHGKDFAALAKEFASKKGHEVKVR